MLKITFLGDSNMKNQHTPGNEDFQVFVLWAKYKHLSPWALLSISAFVILALVYIKITPPKYQRVAQVMIMENSNKNEVEAYKSVKLIEQVIRELNLTVNCSKKKGLVTKRLFERSPVVVHFPDSPEEEAFVFRVELAFDHSVILTKFQYQKNKKFNQKIAGKLDEIIKTPIGDVMITPTSYYDEFDKRYPLVIFKNSIQDETISFARNLNVTTATENMDMIDLKIIDTNIQRAEKFLHTLIELRNKEDEDDMTLAMNTTTSRIIRPPSGNDDPVSPPRIFLLIVAFTFGIGFPGSYIWIKENQNTWIRGKNDLGGLTVPLLGVISLAESDQKKNREEYIHVSETDGDLMLNETFRMVCTNMEFACGKDMKVVMFTSFESGCGKTFVALNLAMSFALAGKKVALVDTDLRTAALNNICEWKDPDLTSWDLSICSFLAGQVTYTQLLLFHMRKRRFYNAFDIFPVGTIPPNPTELLMSERFKDLIENLKRRYDYVFLDATPLDIVSDASIVRKHADLSVFIVREGHTDRRKLYDLEKIYLGGQFNNMAMILNGSKLNRKNHKYYQKEGKEVAGQIPGCERLEDLAGEETNSKVCFTFAAL